MNRINQVQKLAAALAVTVLAVALTACDSGTSKKVSQAESMTNFAQQQRAKAKREEGKKAIMTNTIDPFGGFK